MKITKILSPILNELDDIDGKSHLIKQCYKFFYEQLREKPQDAIVGLWDSLFDKDNKMLVVIDLGDNDQEQKIFDTINSAGVPLSSTDIIKNALYQKLIELTRDEDAVSDYYKASWENTFERDEGVVTYWTAKKSIGRLMRQNSEILLHTVAIIKGIFDVEKKDHTIQKLADIYKKEIEEYDEKQLKALISEITCYAKLYKEHIPDFNGKEVFEYNDVDLEAVGNRVAHILDMNEISTFNPYIVFLYREYASDETLLIKKLHELEKYVMFHLITGKTIKNFNKDCASFIKDIQDKKEMEIQNRLKSFSREELRVGISRNVSNKLASVILFWIELRRRQNPKYETHVLQYNYQLEHIMSQKWEDNWMDVDYVSEDGSVLPKDENSKRIRYEKIYSLGNMTLLSGRLNAAISNNSFKTKMEGDGRKKGIKQYASLSITQDDLVREIYDSQRPWNEQIIIERERYLGEELVALWG